MKNLLEACSNKINSEDGLFDEIYEHNEKLKKKLPKNIVPGFDGMTLNL